MKKLILNTVALVVLGQVVPGMFVSGVWGALGAVIVYTLLTWSIGALVKIITIPINFLTFGLVHFLIGGWLLYWTSSWINGLKFRSFWVALFVSAVLSFVQSWLFDRERAK